MNDELLRLKALAMIQSADTSSVLGVLKAVVNSLREDFPDLPDVDAEFLKRRKELLHLLLEDYEKTNPALAARMQQVIDKASKNHPFDYE